MYILLQRSENGKIFMISPMDFCFLAMYRNLHIFLFYMNQNNVISHLADIAEWDHIFLLPPQNPQNAPGPGTMMAVIHPLFISKSTSPTNPSLLQSCALITSFCFKSEIRKTHRTCLFCYILCVFSLVLFKVK